MQNQSLLTLSYSLEGALKRILYKSTGELPEDQLVSQVETYFPVPETRSKEPVRTRIHKALTAAHSPFVEKNGGWGLGPIDGEQLHEEVYRLFLELGKPMKQGEILRLLQQRTHRSKGDLMSRVNLESDWRFARLEDGEWVLTEWEELADTDTKHTKEETTNMNNVDLIATITIDLQEQLDRLDKRQQEIPQEVVECFHSEDLKSIENLMQEKKKIEGFANDLRELMDKWSSQRELIHA